MIRPLAGAPTTRGSAVAWGFFTAVAAASALLILRNPYTRLATPLTAAVLVAGAAAIGHKVLFAWRTMLGVIVAVLLLVPIRRYQLPSALPFNVELYRLLLFVAVLLWLAALLADRRVRLARTALDPALGSITLVYLASIAACGHRLDQPGLGSAAIKAFTLFLSMVIFFYMIMSLTRTYEDVEAIVRVLVACGAIVAFFSIIEARAHFNVFNDLQRVLPFLHRTSEITAADLERSGHVRALASAEHPIALSALLVMLVPLGAYLAERTRQRRWLLATALLFAAALATLSRTGIVMLLVIGLIYAWLRPQVARRVVRRGWKYVIPLLIAVHFVMPGTLGTFQDLFFANGGVVQQQSGGNVGSGRLASLGPGLHVVGQHFFLGLGYGTRITGDPDPSKNNSFIVDDSWLSTAMEAGVAAIVCWLWIFSRFVRSLRRAARNDTTSRGHLLIALIAAAYSFAVGMTTYDAFSFLQVTFVLFIVFALGCAALRAKPPAAF